MKRKTVKLGFLKFVSLLLILINGVNAQSSQFEKGFNIGFKEGYCYNHTGAFCTAPITPMSPLPRINENQNSYNDGYNRGFQVGLDLQRLEGGLGNSKGTLYQSIPKYRFNEYISDLPVEALVSVGIYKQKLLDSRVKWMQQRLYDIEDLEYSLIHQFSTIEYEKLVKQQTDFYNKNFVGKKIDWSDDFYFNQIVNYFKVAERNIYAVFTNLKIEANSKVIEINPDCNYTQKNIYLLTFNDKIYCSLSQNIKDSLDYNFYYFKNRADDNNGVYIFYLISKKAYFSIDEATFNSQSSRNLQAVYVTSCDAVFIADISDPKENFVVVLDKGEVPEIEYQGIKTYKNSLGYLSSFAIYANNVLNKGYYIPENIWNNPIQSKIYSIDKK